MDRTIRIWEEQLNEVPESGRRFLEKCRLGDFKTTCQDIEFCPRHLGLKIASVGADGLLRIYEAMDPMNLTNWTITDNIEVGQQQQQQKEIDGQYSLSWCSSKFLPPMIVIGKIVDRVW